MLAPNRPKSGKTGIKNAAEPSTAGTFHPTRAGERLSACGPAAALPPSMPSPGIDPNAPCALSMRRSTPSRIWCFRDSPRPQPCAPCMPGDPDSAYGAQRPRCLTLAMTPWPLIDLSIPGVFGSRFADVSASGLRIWCHCQFANLGPVPRATPETVRKPDARYLEFVGRHLAPGLAAPPDTPQR
jgi:hypothetical protein